MKYRSPIQQDLAWCPDGTPAKRTEKVSFRGPFLFVTACIEKSSSDQKNPWCLMFITGISMIITPVHPEKLQAVPKGDRPAGEQKSSPPSTHTWFHGDRDSGMFEQLETLVCQYRDADPGTVFVAEQDAQALPLDTIKEIAITRVRSTGGFSHLLSLFSLYPVEPANARYHVNFQLEITTGTTSFTFITPFSFELKQILRGLLGEKVHEICDEYAPLL
jgi:hypothetical protein